MTTPSWDDMRVAAAVSGLGSVRKAAEQLGIHHASVVRRVAALEEQLKVRVFERTSGRYVLTEPGRALLEAANRMESAVDGFLRKLGAQDKLAGTLVLTMPETLVALLTEELARFCERHPEIHLELRVGVAMAELTRREADLALRITASPAENLTGRRFGQLALRAYASRAYLDRICDQPPAAHLWIGYPKHCSSLEPAAWMRQNIPPERIVATTDSAEALLKLVAAGVGVGFLAEHAAQRCAALAPVPGIQPLLTPPVWLLTHPDLRESPRVRVMADFLHAVLAANEYLR